MKIIEKIQEFKNDGRLFGVYRVEYKNDKYIVALNGDDVKVLVHYDDRTELVYTTQSFKEMLLESLNF